MLIGKWATILRVTAQAELIDIRTAQILPQRTTMWIVAVDAGDLSLAIRVMVRETALRSLRLVAPEGQASLVSARGRIAMLLSGVSSSTIPGRPRVEVSRALILSVAAWKAFECT